MKHLLTALLFAAPLLTTASAQQNPILEERFGFRTWRLGEALDPAQLTGATAVQATEPCFQVHRIESGAAGSLKHLKIEAIDVTYQAEALQNVSVVFSAEAFTEVLDACEQVFGPSETVSGASSTGGDVMQWMGEGIYLELGIGLTSEGEQVTRLAYEWTTPTSSYDACVESKRPKFNVGDF